MPAAKDSYRSLLLLAVSLLLAASAFPGFAQDKPSFAVLPFEAVDLPQAEAGAVSALFQSNMERLGVYALLPGGERERILQDEGAGRACTDLKCAVRLGGKLSVEQLAVGSVAWLEGAYIINAKIVDVASASILAADSIRAGSREELDAACGLLTRDLVNRAMPGSLAAAEAAPAAGGPQEGSAAPAEGAPDQAAGPSAALPGQERPGQEGPGQEGPGRERPPTAETARAGGGRLRPLLTVGGGILLMEVGNVAASVSFELNRRMSDDYVAYEQTSWNFDALWKDYTSARFGYVFNTALAYSGWAAGLASIPAYLYLFPEQAFRLSRKGSIVFALGAGLSVAGNVLDLLACQQRYRNDFLYADYLAAGTDLDALYSRYLRGYVVYSFERLGSYALWLAGGAGMIGSFFWKGEPRQPLSGTWDRTLLVAGASLAAAGSLTRSASLNCRQLFMESGGYDESSYDRYRTFSVLSYALWAAGATGLVLPFIVDVGRRQPPAGPAETRPERLRLVPLPTGLLFQVSF